MKTKNGRRSLIHAMLCLVMIGGMSKSNGCSTPPEPEPEPPCPAPGPGQKVDALPVGVILEV